MLELPKSNPKSASKCCLGPSSAQTGYRACPRRSLEVGQERVHVHVGQFIRLAVRRTGALHAFAAAIGWRRSGCRRSPQAAVSRASRKMCLRFVRWVKRRRNTAEASPADHSSFEYNSEIMNSNLREDNWEPQRGRKGRLVFGVQYHPVVSAGPPDSQYLFHRFLVVIGDGSQTNV